MTTDENKCTKDPNTCGYWRECEVYINAYPNDTRTKKVMQCTAADMPTIIVGGRDAWKCPFANKKGEAK